MTHIVPCEDPANDPEDWFIEKDGRQYPDDDLLTDEDRYMAWSAVQERERRELTIEEKDAAINEAEDDAQRAALKRRRHAKDKCYVECYFRNQCLAIALTKPEPSHGTWGGYYTEELKKIRDLRDERAARQSQDADVAAEE